jgi:hypothetical protein
MPHLLGSHQDDPKGALKAGRPSKQCLPVRGSQALPLVPARPVGDQSRIGSGPFLRIGRLYRVEGKVPDATLTLGDLHHPAPQFSFGLSNSANNLYRDLPSGDIISQIHAVRSLSRSSCSE